MIPNRVRGLVPSALTARLPAGAFAFRRALAAHHDQVLQRGVALGPLPKRCVAQQLEVAAGNGQPGQLRG